MTATSHLPSDGISPGTSHMGTSSTVGMSVEAAAQALGCSQNTVRRWIKQRRVRAERVARPQGHEWRVFLDAAPTLIGTSQPETSHAATSHLPTEVPAAWLAPIAQELAAARQQIATQAETIGTLRAQLAALQAPAPPVEAPAAATDGVEDPPRPWWAFWRPKKQGG